MVNELTLLDNFDKAKALIVQADLVEAIDWINKGEALKVYATKAKKGQEIQNQCAEIKLRAERRAGEILRDMEKNEGGRPPENQLQAATSLPPKLSDLGVSKIESHRWQLEASVPEEKFTEFAESIKKKGEELTSAGLRRLAIREIHQDIETPPLPEGAYRTIIIDPPWPIEKIQREVRPNQLDYDYPIMTIDEIKAFRLPINTEGCQSRWDNKGRIYKPYRYPPLNN